MTKVSWWRWARNFSTIRPKRIATYKFSFHLVVPKIAAFRDCPTRIGKSGKFHFVQFSVINIILLYENKMSLLPQTEMYIKVW